MIMKIQERYAKAVNNHIWILTGNKIMKLKEDIDVERMINYMLMIGNLVVDSDNELTIQIGYNLNVNKYHYVIQ